LPVYWVAMPPRVLAFICVFAYACMPGLAWAHAGPAPADEYFGPFKESVLEIRNRLTAFERDTNRILARSVHGIDTLELTIEDWYRKYPADPWIRGFSRRLCRIYMRAHYGRDVHYTRARLMAR